jgi:hypothetical protein
MWAPLISQILQVGVAIAVLGGVEAWPTLARDVPVSRFDTTVDIGCFSTTLTQDASWYLPAGDVQGLVWVQHGFARTGDNVADLATHFAAQGYIAFAPSLPTINVLGCTLENLGDNDDFLSNVADLFGQATNSSEKLGRSFASATAAAGRPELELPQEFVFSGHSAGGEAVLFVANTVRVSYPAAWTGLRGLVLLDPVKSFIGTHFDDALAGLDTTVLPVLSVSAPDLLCNNNGGGTDALQAGLHRAFVGVRLTTGVHTDAEGASTDIIGEIACGTPVAANVAILQTLAVGWSVDYFAGSTTASYYPGGSYYESQLVAGTIETLVGAS